MTQIMEDVKVSRSYLEGTNTLAENRPEWKAKQS